METVRRRQPQPTTMGYGRSPSMERLEPHVAAESNESLDIRQHDAENEPDRSRSSSSHHAKSPRKHTKSPRRVAGSSRGSGSSKSPVRSSRSHHGHQHRSLTEETVSWSRIQSGSEESCEEITERSPSLHKSRDRLELNKQGNSASYRRSTDENSVGSSSNRPTLPGRSNSLKSGMSATRDDCSAEATSSNSQPSRAGSGRRGVSRSKTSEEGMMRSHGGRASSHDKRQHHPHHSPRRRKGDRGHHHHDSKDSSEHRSKRSPRRSRSGDLEEMSWQRSPNPGSPALGVRKTSSSKLSSSSRRSRGERSGGDDDRSTTAASMSPPRRSKQDFDLSNAPRAAIAVSVSPRRRPHRTRSNDLMEMAWERRASKGEGGRRGSAQTAADKASADFKRSKPRRTNSLQTLERSTVHDVMKEDVGTAAMKTGAAGFDNIVQPDSKSVDNLVLPNNKSGFDNIAQPNSQARFSFDNIVQPRASVVRRDEATVPVEMAWQRNPSPKRNSTAGSARFSPNRSASGDLPRHSVSGPPVKKGVGRTKSGDLFSMNNSKGRLPSMTPRAFEDPAEWPCPFEDDPFDNSNSKISGFSSTSKPQSSFSRRQNSSFSSLSRAVDSFTMDGGGNEIGFACAPRQPHRRAMRRTSSLRITSTSDWSAMEFDDDAKPVGSPSTANLKHGTSVTEEDLFTVISPMHGSGSASSCASGASKHGGGLSSSLASSRRLQRASIGFVPSLADDNMTVATSATGGGRIKRLQDLKMQQQTKSRRRGSAGESSAMTITNHAIATAPAKASGLSSFDSGFASGNQDPFATPLSAERQTSKSSLGSELTSPSFW